MDLVSKVSEIQVGMTYHSESFSDDRVHDGQLLEVLVSVVSESTVRVTELLFLLLIKSLSTSSSVMLRHSKFLQKTYTTSGRSARWRRVQEEVAEEVCWPAIRRAIMMWAMSRSERGTPFRYLQLWRFSIMSCSCYSNQTRLLQQLEINSRRFHPSSCSP